MLGLPEFGQLVRVWPMPGRQVQDGPRPVDRWAGGAWLPAGGKVVEWTPFHLEQLRYGDILLHHPPCEEHDHGEEKGECTSCGRAQDEAAKYDAHARPARAAHAARMAKAGEPAEPGDGKPKLHDRAAATQAHMVAAGLHKEQPKDKAEQGGGGGGGGGVMKLEAKQTPVKGGSGKSTSQDDGSER